MFVMRHDDKIQLAMSMLRNISSMAKSDHHKTQFLVSPLRFMIDIDVIKHLRIFNDRKTNFSLINDYL